MNNKCKYMTCERFLCMYRKTVCFVFGPAMDFFLLFSVVVFIYAPNKIRLNIYITVIHSVQKKV